ncbi:MAG: MFS transporter [Hyphomicrobiales bacterium]
MFARLFDGIETEGVWAAISNGLIFSARGAFIPYFFVFFQQMSSLSYTETTILLNSFVLSQSVISPLVGGLVEKVKSTLWPAILFALYISAFLIIVESRSGFFLSLALVILGAAFSTSRLVFNRRIIATAGRKGMRRTISLRAGLMTGGSFCGNAAGAFILVQFGPYPFISYVFLLFFISVCIFLITFSKPENFIKEKCTNKKIHLRSILITDFHKELIDLVPPFLLYGCWGTLLPKYIIDSLHNLSAIPAMYAATTTAIVTLTWFFNTSVFDYLRARNIKDSVYPMLSTLFFSAGSLAIAFSVHIWSVIIGGVIFVIGEIIITPHLDEISRRHGRAQTGLFIGITQAVDGAVRFIGLLTGSIIYGVLNDTGARLLTVPIIVGIALSVLAVNRFVVKPALGKKR